MRASAAQIARIVRVTARREDDGRAVLEVETEPGAEPLTEHELQRLRALVFEEVKRMGFCWRVER